MSDNILKDMVIAEILSVIAIPIMLIGVLLSTPGICLILLAEKIGPK